VLPHACWVLATIRRPVAMDARVPRRRARGIRRHVHVPLLLRCDVRVLARHCIPI
jgi:hypothetical protein